MASLHLHIAMVKVVETEDQKNVPDPPPLVACRLPGITAVAVTAADSNHTPNVKLIQLSALFW